MPKFAIEKITAIEEKELAKEGQQKLALMDDAEAGVYRNVNLATYRAWDFGRYLIGAKEKIGLGLFEAWRNSRFPKVHERKARRCQELFSLNSERTELSALSERAINKW